MLDKQQLISAISTSILTSDSSLQKNNMAPQFDLCPDFSWTWVMFPFCFSQFFLPTFSSSLLFSVHPYFSVYWYSSCSSTSASQERKTLHKLVQNLKLSVVINTGCETENYPPLSFLFLLFLGVRGYQLTIPQTMNPLWQDGIDYQRHCCLSGPRQPYRKNINYGFLRCRASQQDFVMCKKILKKACEQIWQIVCLYTSLCYGPPTPPLFC